MVKPPAREPSDFGIAHSAEPALFMPEKAKRTLAGMGTLSEGFERFVAAPLLPRRLPAMARRV